jgi:hypothetical protein
LIATMSQRLNLQRIFLLTFLFIDASVELGE